MRFLFAVFLALHVTTPLGLRAEEAVRHGLLWHKSGLPAVFPLQIKTAPGRDYHVMLLLPGTQDGVLGAYIKGGQFFRVLVPPGTYDLRLSYGTDWHGTDALFGTGPRVGEIVFDAPFTFETRGIGTKSGHLIDLTRYHTEDGAQAQLKSVALCQRAKGMLKAERNSRFGLDIATRRYEPNAPTLPLAARTLDDDDKLDPGLEPRLDLEISVQSKVCS